MHVISSDKTVTWGCDEWKTTEAFNLQVIGFIQRVKAFELLLQYIRDMQKYNTLLISSLPINLTMWRAL